MNELDRSAEKRYRSDPAGATQRDGDEAVEIGLEAGPGLTRGRVLWMSTAVGLAMVAIAALVQVVWRGAALRDFFSGGASAGVQIGAATAAALGAAAVVSAVTILWRPIEPARRLARRMMDEVDPTPLDMVIVAATAGFCEELLFRGAIQPSLGVWWTSLVFMMAHGVVLPLTWRRALFGATIFSLSVGLGMLARHVGLASAMLAHGLYDLAVLLALDQWRRRTTQAGDGEAAPRQADPAAPEGERG